MRVVADLEANGLLDTITKIWCLVAKDIDTGDVFKFDFTNTDGMKHFLDQCSVVIGHNFLGYDVPALEKVLGYKFPEDTFIIDTYILSQILEPDRKKHIRTSGKKGPHSLENFGNIFKRYKPEHEDWSQFSPEMLHRCTEDVEINLLAFQMLNRKAKLFDPKSKWLIPYKIEAGFSKCVSKQEQRGINVHKEKLDTNITDITKMIKEIDDELIPKLPKVIKIHEVKTNGEWGWNKKPFKGNGELGKYTVDWCNFAGYNDPSIISGPFSRISFLDFDLGSVQLVKEYLISQGWKPLKWNTKVGPDGVERKTSPKMDKEEEFIGVNSNVGQIVAKRMIYRHRLSQLQGFKDKLRPDGRLTAAITGITPTVRCKHAVVVNIPGADAVLGEKMREIFIPSPGYVFVGCDAASCQLRNLCHHMGDDEYTDAVINGDKDKGTDIHSVNMKAAGLDKKSHAKRFIYGFLFGSGDEKTGSIIGGGRAAGKKIKEQFLATLPKLKLLIDRLRRQFKIYKYVHGLDGREIYPRSNHEVLCYQLQSDEAILMKVATIYVNRWINEEELDAHMVAHMHDEYLFEAKPEHSKRVGELAEKAICKAGEWLKMNVPMKGEAQIGNSWWEVH